MPTSRMISGEPSGATPFQGASVPDMGTCEMPFNIATRSFLRVAEEVRSISGPSAPKSSKYTNLLSGDQLGFCNTTPVAKSDHFPVLRSRSIIFLASAERVDM